MVYLRNTQSRGMVEPPAAIPIAGIPLPDKLASGYPHLAYKHLAYRHLTRLCQLRTQMCQLLTKMSVRSMLSGRDCEQDDQARAQYSHAASGTRVTCLAHIWWDIKPHGASLLSERDLGVPAPSSENVRNNFSLWVQN